MPLPDLPPHDAGPPDVSATPSDLEVEALRAMLTPPPPRAAPPEPSPLPPRPPVDPETP